MSYSTASHTKYYHRYHVVWATKYRYKVLQGSLRECLRTIIRQTCEELGVHIVRGVLARDHIHMFVSIPPKQSLSDASYRHARTDAFGLCQDYAAEMNA
ncbi:IS200/IS605 family transposase [uncultured Roseibium sp.]|uniref:IS200/IS605 family transposase n=1 Tax=uncultured Roseibium sp. TaxID=1936171 RepID=UPI002620D6E8|nr:IS200/IS605 family transposase [uncultured Roseibium sp.]